MSAPSTPPPGRKTRKAARRPAGPAAGAAQTGLAAKEDVGKTGNAGAAPQFWGAEGEQAAPVAGELGEKDQNTDLAVQIPVRESGEAEPLSEEIAQR